MTERRPLVIRDGLVLTSGRATPRRIDLLIEDGRIALLGEPGMAVPPEAQILSANNRLLIPGLVNAHTHSHAAFGKGLGSNWTLEMLINASPWYAGGRNTDDLYLGAQLGAAEMIRNGCTACYDMVVEMPVPSVDGINAVARAYADIGMRATVAPAIADGTFWASIPGLIAALPESNRDAIARIQAASAEASLAAMRQIFAQWPVDRTRIRPGLAPSIPLLCSDDFLIAAARLSDEFDTQYHTHVAESKAQAITAMQRYGRTLVAHLDELGVLSPRFGAAHAIWVDEDDLGRLADHGSAIAHNPGSNLRLGNGIARARGMLTARVATGIGTDASSCSDHLNMFEATRMAALSSRAQTPDVDDWLSAGEVLDMATSGSAQVLGFDNIGRLDAGFAADIVFLDLDDLNYLPLNNAVNQVVFCENGAGVNSVMIDGRMIYENGKFLTLDYHRLVTQVNAAGERLHTFRAGVRPQFDALESIVGAFCVGLANQPYHVHRYIGHNQ